MKNGEQIRMTVASRAALSSIMFAAFFFIASPPAAYAGELKTFFVEAGGGFNSAPSPEWSSQTGTSLGLTYRLDENRGVNLSMANNSFTQDVGGTTLKYSRVPVYLGGRFFSWSSWNLWTHFDAGLEYSMDKIESLSGGVVTSKSESNVGAVLGYGIGYDISRTFVAGMAFNYHVNKNSYFSVLISLGAVF